MSLRQSARCCRPAAQVLKARRVPTATRLYSTGPSGSNSGSHAASNLGKLAAGGAVAGFVGAFSFGWLNSPKNEARLDAVPCVDAIETYGKTWEPVHAKEQDDPKVCASCDDTSAAVVVAAADDEDNPNWIYYPRDESEYYYSSPAAEDTGSSVLNVLMLRNPMRIRMAAWVSNLQDHICTSLESLEMSAPPDGEHLPATFVRDHWIRPSGGEGSSCVLAGGRVFEKAGVNVSIVEGKLPKGAQLQMKADHASIEVSDEPLPYFATGLSIVIHPRSPHVPTVHLNYRYFELCDKKGNPIAWWFGGGTDLTPNYLYPEDAELFHNTLKRACDSHDPAYYPAYKKWCDEYFYIAHRGETRGVGGIFFDDLTSSSPIHADKKLSREQIFDFVKSASSAFLPAYIPIVQRRLPTPSTEEQRRWQLVRRGRYVEFNLLYDRGTKFGLNIPGARVESILMSLPEVARWEYMTNLGAEGSGTPEEELQKVLKKPREWATDASAAK